MRGGAIPGTRHRPAQGAAEAQMLAERRGVAAEAPRAPGMMGDGPAEGARLTPDRVRQTASGKAGQPWAQPWDKPRARDLPPPAEIAADVGVEALEQSRAVEDLRHGIGVARADLRDDEAHVSHGAHVEVPGPGRDHARRALWSERSGPSTRAIGARAQSRAVRPAAARFPRSHQCAQAPGDALAMSLPWQLDGYSLGQVRQRRRDPGGCQRSEITFCVNGAGWFYFCVRRSVKGERLPAGARRPTPGARRAQRQERCGPCPPCLRGCSGPVCR